MIPPSVNPVARSNPQRCSIVITRGQRHENDVGRVRPGGRAPLLHALPARAEGARRRPILAPSTAPLSRSRCGYGMSSPRWWWSPRPRPDVSCDASRDARAAATHDTAGAAARAPTRQALDGCSPDCSCGVQGRIELNGACLHRVDRSLSFLSSIVAVRLHRESIDRSRSSPRSSRCVRLGGGARRRRPVLAVAPRASGAPRDSSSAARGDEPQTHHEDARSRRVGGCRARPRRPHW